jgi:hypothetical protein
LKELEGFISKRLTDKLKKDLRKLRIIKEADLECCTYHHLRKFLYADPRWNILTRKSAKRIGRCVDMLIYRDIITKLVIEFKVNRKQIAEKDRTSLCASIRKLRVKKAYSIIANKPGIEFHKMDKSRVEKYHLHEMPVEINLKGRELAKWKKRRDQYVERGEKWCKARK